MTRWTQEEIESMRLADAEIEEDFCMTLEEITGSRERDEYALDGQLDFRNLRRLQYNRAYNKRYYAEHKAALQEKNRAYYAANRARDNERSAAWREKNAEYEQTWQKAYYEENRPFILAKKQASAEVDRAYRRIMREMEAEA